MTSARLIGLLFLIVAGALCSRGNYQSSASLRSVHKVYVADFGKSQDGERLRRDVIAAIKHDHRVTVVPSADQADAILSGNADVWVKGYYSLNPRSRSMSDAHPVYGGYLSVELKDRHEETVWSYLATPRRFGPEDVARDLTGQIAKKLREAIEAEGSNP